MENFLLLFDELDDLYSTMGLIWRPIASLLFACFLFAATGFIFIAAPMMAQWLGVALVGIGLLELVRKRMQSVAAQAAAEVGQK
jgi:hypothetical protein